MYTQGKRYLNQYIKPEFQYKLFKQLLETMVNGLELLCDFSLGRFGFGS